MIPVTIIFTERDTKYPKNVKIIINLVIKVSGHSKNTIKLFCFQKFGFNRVTLNYLFYLRKS